MPSTGVLLYHNTNMDNLGLFSKEDPTTEASLKNCFEQHTSSGLTMNWTLFAQIFNQHTIFISAIKLGFPLSSITTSK